jgi:hypothetical protein
MKDLFANLKNLVAVVIRVQGSFTRNHVKEWKRSIPGNNKRLRKLKVKASDFYLSISNEK